jgi:hypothetical protein
MMALKKRQRNSFSLLSKQNSLLLIIEGIGDVELLAVSEPSSSIISFAISISICDESVSIARPRPTATFIFSSSRFLSNARSRCEKHETLDETDDAEER